MSEEENNYERTHRRGIPTQFGFIETTEEEEQELGIDTTIFNTFTDTMEGIAKDPGAFAERVIGILKRAFDRAEGLLHDYVFYPPEFEAEVKALIAELQPLVGVKAELQQLGYGFVQPAEAEEKAREFIKNKLTQRFESDEPNGAIVLGPFDVGTEPGTIRDALLDKLKELGIEVTEDDEGNGE